VANLKGLLPRKYSDISGQRFGKLLALWPVASLGHVMLWAVQCDCGTVKTARSCNLHSGTATSCGKHNTYIKHGHARAKKSTPEYRAYCSAKCRCENHHDPRYPRYGSRGIKFKFASFQEFFSALGPRPPKMTLDRIDNDGNYEAGNVRWTTRLENARNKSRRKWLP
jgi:hypothetical protein